MNNEAAKANEILTLAKNLSFFANPAGYVMKFWNSSAEMHAKANFIRLAIRPGSNQIQLTGDGMKRTNPMVRNVPGRCRTEDSTRRKKNA